MNRRMHPLVRAINAYLIVMILLSPRVSVCAQLATGVNNVHLGWLKADQREKVLEEMARAGVKSVRVGMVAPFEQSIDALAAVERHGMSVELVVSLTGGQLIAPHPALRPGRGSIWPGVGLSQLEPDFFKVHFGSIWQEIEKRQIHLVAIELGNEINWAAFNGDLGVVAPGQSPSPGAPGLAGLADPAVYSKGLRNYIQALAIVKEMRDASIVNRHAALLSAGLASMSASFAAGMGAEYVDAVQTLAILKGMRLDAIVDGYALHSYPDRRARPTERERVFDALISLCGREGGHACWLTEWSVAEPVRACEIDDKAAGQSQTVIVEMNKVIASRAAQGRLAAAYYFDWDGATEPYAIWRCGHLTESGKAVLQP